MTELHSILYGKHVFKWVGCGNEGEKIYELYKCECGAKEKRYHTEEYVRELREQAHEIVVDTANRYDELISQGKTPEEANHIVVWGREAG